MTLGNEAFSIANFPINTQKSARLHASQYFCHKGSMIVLTIEVDSTNPLFAGSELRQPSGPIKSKNNVISTSAAS